MKLSELLSPEAIRLDLQVSSKWEAIEILVNFLVEQRLIPLDKKDQALQSVVEREKSMSTGIGKGIAIPHAACTSVVEAVGVYAHLSKPIEFGAVDGQPVEHIVLMVIPRAQYQDYIKTLACSARCLTLDAVREELKAAQSGEEALAVIKKAESL